MESMPNLDDSAHNKLDNNLDNIHNIWKCYES